MRPRRPRAGTTPRPLEGDAATRTRSRRAATSPPPRATTTRGRRPRHPGAVVLVAALVVSAAVPAVADARAASRCPTPGRIVATPSRAGVAVVAWRPSAAVRRDRPSYRVLRGSAVVGQTRRTRLTVRAPAGRTITVRVGVVRAGGRAPRCWSRRRFRMAVAPKAAAPATPAGLAVQATSPTTLQLSWQPARGARAYRVLRDGAVVRQAAGATATVAVAPGGAHAFTVRGVGAGGRLGAASRAVRWDPQVVPPGAPRGLAVPVTASDRARLTWEPAAAGTFPIRSYRVLRDGVVVGQTPATGADVTGLVPDRQSNVSVLAVDSRGIAGPSASATVRPLRPAPSTGDLHAFVLASTDASFRSLQEHYREVGIAYPTYFDCVPSAPGTVAGKDDPLITRWLKDRDIDVLPRFNCQRPATLRTLLTDPATRSALIARLVALAVDHDYDGLNLDLEAGAPQDRDGLSAFVADLAAALHRVGLKLSVDVSPKFRDVPNHPRSTFFDYRVLAQHADWVWVMSWGLHWTTSGPGPLAPADWLQQITAYVRTMPDPSRFVLGLPLYGMDWPAGGGVANPATPLTHAQIQALVARTGAQPRRDPVSRELTFSYVDDAGVPHEVWFGDAASVRSRMGLAAGLGGVGVWRLGQEDPAFWTLPPASR